MLKIAKRAIDEQENIETVNPATEDMYGYKPGELMEKHGGSLHLESDGKRGTAAIVTLPANRVRLG